MIGIGSDHGGFELKTAVKEFLEQQGLEVRDYGCFDKSSVDYPDIAEAVCRDVVSGKAACGMLFCGTGIGISIAANKIDGIRAAHVTDSYSARMAREHNNANVICLGGRILGVEIALEIVKAYLNASFAGGRHQGRVDKITALEQR